jgi:hypothetical protein
MRDLEKFDLEDLEMRLFKVLDLKEANIGSFENRDLHDLFSWDAEFVRIVGQEGNKKILSNGSNFYLDEIGKIRAEIGDFGIIDSSEFIKIESPERFDFKKLNELWDDKNWDSLEPEVIPNQVLTKEYIDEVIKAFEKKDKEDELLQEQRQEQEVEVKIDKNKLFKETGIYEDNNIKIENKILIIKDEATIELEKDWKEVFSLDSLNGYWGRKNTEYYRNILIDKKESFIIKEVEEGVIIFEINVKFEEKKVTFNGNRINSNKIKFLMNRLKAEEYNNAELISKYNKLTGMKADLVDMKLLEIDKRDGRNLKIPFRVSLTDFDDTLRVNCLGRETELSWEKCKDYFFYGGKSRRLDATLSIAKVMVMMGVTDKENKQKAYDYLKRIVMLNNLDDGNDD